MNYEELLAIQQQHLAIWRKRVRPEVIEPIAQYVLAMNQESTEPSQKHRVYRGQDLIELIRTWPNRNVYVYPDPPSEAQDMI